MPPVKGVRVQLDKARTLRYDNRAIVKLEEATDLTVQQLMTRLRDGSMKAVNQLVWAGLLHADPDLGFDAVLDIVDLKRLEEIGEAVAKAVEQAFGVNGDAPEGKAGAATEQE